MRKVGHATKASGLGKNIGWTMFAVAAYVVLGFLDVVPLHGGIKSATVFAGKTLLVLLAIGLIVLLVIVSGRRAHPIARLRLLAWPIEETIREVRMNEADLGIVPARAVPEELFFRAIGTWRACLITQKGHPVSRRAQTDFSSLLNRETMDRYPLVVFEAQLGTGVFADVILVPAELKVETTYGLVMRRDKHKGPLLKDLLALLSGIART